MLAGLSKQLQIPYEAISAGNHRAVRVKRSFCYLNKVEQIMAANAQSLTVWLHGVFFGFYGWNPSQSMGPTSSNRSLKRNTESRSR